MNNAAASEAEQLPPLSPEKRTYQLPGYVRPIVILTIANMLVLVSRNIIVGDTFFNFLKSNLFIGSFPVILIAFLMDMYSARFKPVLFWLCTAVWVLFYPNAPYMISDLIHDSQDPNDVNQIRVIYDTLIIFSIAML